jgi:DNA polymerase beta
MKNKIIITEFEKLVKQIQFDIDNSPNQKLKMINMFRLQNIKKVLKVIQEFPKEITNVDQLKNISGVGKGSLDRVQEILNTGKLKEINEDAINDKYLQYIDELEEVFGIGRKKALELFSKYKVKSIEELKKLYKEKKIDLPENIVTGLKYHGKYKEKIPRKEIDKINDYLQKMLLKVDPQLFGIICGSYRRLSMTSNDIDMLIIHPKIKTKEDVVTAKKNYLELFINKLVDTGFIIDSLTGTDVSTKYMGLCKLNNNPLRRIDIRFIPYESYYYALLYFTGPKDFNRKTRQLAIDMNYLLNEYGLYDKTGKSFKVNSEKEILELLNMEYVEPDKRS